MIFLVFVTAVLVSGAFERQARRHRFELEMEYERLGIPVPPPRPKLKRAEAWMNVVIGILLVLMSIYSIQAGFGYMKAAEDAARERPAMASTFNDAVGPMFITGAFFLAGGIALAWLGWKAVREITRFESGASGALAVSGSGAATRGETGYVHRPARFTLTAAIAAGAFFAGILTGYLFLSSAPSSSHYSGAVQSTVSIEIQAAGESGIPPGFSDELLRRVREELGSLPGVSIVQGMNANYSFKARISRDDGFINISWNVIRARDRAVFFNRTFSIPAEMPVHSIQTMISSLSTTFGEKRTLAEFERILQLPEHSLD